jgi:hypothetical protein
VYGCAEQNRTFGPSNCAEAIAQNTVGCICPWDNRGVVQRCDLVYCTLEVGYYDGQGDFIACPSSCTNGDCSSSCTTSSDCPAGKACSAATHMCASGACSGPITCTTAKPTCPTGKVPLILDGCYTGSCYPSGSCILKPPCANISDETNCIARNCSAVYKGIDCRKPDGTACHSGDTGCTCASYEFASCTDK